jgi:RNA polymerase sigma-70 factor (ECF subfamily)
MAEQRILEDLLRQHERPILRLCFRLLGNWADAQDAAQEVFMKAYRHLGDYNPEKPASPWLYQIAVNTCRDQLRRRRPVLELVPDGPPSPEQLATAGEQQALLLGALDSLGPKEREAVVLREIEGLPTREVAQLLQSSEETVRSQVSLAKTKLRAFVEREQARRT